MTVPIKTRQRLRPLVYKHIVETAHHVDSHCLRDKEGRALVYCQVIHLRKK